MDNLNNAAFSKAFVMVGGKRLSLITDETDLLSANAVYIQDLYEQICLEYNNKLDRESIFLFIVFKLMNEDVLKLQNIFFDLEQKLNFVNK